MDAGVDRRRRVCDHIRNQGRADVVTLANNFCVSTETIRRDLKVLEAQSLVQRFHGGAAATETTSFETTLEMRSARRVEEKKRIALAAADLIQGSDTVFLDEGYTPYLVAQALTQATDRLTVVTPSLQIGALLATSHHDTILLGGLIRGRTLGTVEHWTTDMLSKFNFATAVLGANGISRDGGLTTPDARVAAVKAEALKRSRRKIFVGVHTKFGVTGFNRFGEVSDLDVIVTEQAVPIREAQLYMALGPKVIRT